MDMDLSGIFVICDVELGIQKNYLSIISLKKRLVRISWGQSAINTAAFSRSLASPSTVRTSSRDG